MKKAKQIQRSTKIVSLILLIFSALLYVACDSHEKVSDSVINEDLCSWEELFDCYSSEYTYDAPYELTDSSVIKRQINLESKNDIIYHNVVLENKYFRIYLDTKMQYIFYDEGGWILEEQNYTITEIVPIAPLEPALLLQKLIDAQCVEAYTKVSGVSFVEPIGDRGHYKTRIILDKMNKNVCVQGEFEMTFINGRWNYANSDDRVWPINSENVFIDFDKVLDVHFDYEKIFGKFIQEYWGTESTYLNITGVDLSNHTITYWYCDRYDDDWREKIALFDLDELVFYANHDRFIYDVDDDNWLCYSGQFYPDVLKRYDDYYGQVISTSDISNEHIEREYNENWNKVRVID